MKKLSISMTQTERALGFFMLALQVLILPGLLSQANTLLGYPLSEVELNFVFFCLEFICVTAVLHRFLLKSLATFWQTFDRAWKHIALGLVVYAGANFAVSSLILFLYPDFQNINDGSILKLAQENFALTAIGTVLLVPPVEELLYRGVIFKTLYDKHPLLGYLVSTLAFSALHVIGYIGKYSPVHLLFCLVQYFPAAICLSWSYVRSDTIAVPMLMHMVINFVGILSMR